MFTASLKDKSGNPPIKAERCHALVDSIRLVLDSISDLLEMRENPFGKFTGVGGVGLTKGLCLVPYDFFDVFLSVATLTPDVML